MVSLKGGTSLRLCAGVCAVVGGVFAVTGMTDRWIHRAVNLMHKVD